MIATEAEPTDATWRDLCSRENIGLDSLGHSRLMSRNEEIREESGHVTFAEEEERSGRQALAAPLSYPSTGVGD